MEYLNISIWLYLVFFLLVILSGLNWIIVFIFKKYKKLALFFSLVSLSLILSLTVSSAILNHQSQQTQIKAKPIIELIHRYKKENNVFPNSLNEIEREYSFIVPKTNIGVLNKLKYRYNLYRGEYTLWYKWNWMDINGSYEYSSKNNNWRYDD